MSTNLASGDALHLKSILSNERGLSLIEISIVLIISGLIMASALSSYGIYVQKKVIRETYDSMALARTALGDFYKRNGRYPCPATPAANENGILSGEEVCTTDDYKPERGLQLVDGMDANKDGEQDQILSGTLPFATLGVNLDQTIDGWNRQLAYAVTARLTRTDDFNESMGAIYLRKADGETPVRKIKNKETGFHALIFSRGRNGRGGYTATGQPFLPCDTETVDAKNCDADGTFVADVLSLGDSPTYFDDIVTVQLRSTFDLWPSIKGMCTGGEFVYGVSPSGDVLCRKP